MAPHALALHALHGPERGRDVRSRDHSSPEGSVVRGAQSGRAAVTRRRPDSRARERSGTTRRRRSVHACEWSKPPPYVGTWFSRSPPCVSARVGCTWRSKLPAASDPMLAVPRERRRTSEIGLDRERLRKSNLHHAERQWGSAPRRRTRRGSRDREVPLTRVHRKRSIEADAPYRASPPGSPPRERWGSRGAVSRDDGCASADADDASRGRLEVGL